jgi:type I restriction enzyme S subunit
MAGWEVKILGEVCTIKPPKAEARAKLSEVDEVSFAPMEDLGIGVKYLQPHRTRQLGEVSGSYTYFADGDVLLAKITPCFENGKLGVARGLKNGVGFGSSEYVVLRPTAALDAEFLYYYLARPVFLEEGARHMAGAVGHKRVTKEFVDRYPIPLPPLPEQRRIVTILDEAFECIATAKANAEKNLQNARELCEELMQALFPEDSIVSDAAPSLDSLCELIVDCEHKTAPTQESGIPSIRTPNIGKGRLLLDGVYRVSEATYKEWTARAEPQGGDLILAREAPAGNVAVVPVGLKVCLGQRTVLIRPRKSVLEPDYLAQLLLRQNSQRRLLAHSRGATVQHINMKDIRAFKIAGVPSIDQQRRVVDRVNELFEMEDRLVAIYQRKLAALDELKKSLLHQAFTGQLTAAKQARVVLQSVLPTTTPEFAANVIALAQVRHERQRREKTFGHVKEQKLLHLVESIGKIDLGRQPMRDAAGPNDFQHMLKAEEWARAHHFFEMAKRGEGYEFRKLSAFDEHLSKARRALGPYLQQLERVIDLLVPMNKVEAEVFATVHAAWNNLLIDGADVTDEAIISAAREGWHPDKLDIPVDKFQRAIELIRQQGLVPDGTAKYVGGQQALL